MGRLRSLMIIGSLVILGCEDAPDIPDPILPLSGDYSLTDMTISVVATTVRDTVVSFLAPYNNSETYLLPANRQVLRSSVDYSNQDTDPIGGTVILRNYGSAHLGGLLPVNWGTGCEPVLLISALSSDGTWSADTSDGTFSIDLVVDALDIDGTFSLNGNQLEIRYFTTVEIDERPIDSVLVDDVTVAIVPGCFSVSTVTERILKLTIME